MSSGQHFSAIADATKPWQNQVIVSGDLIQAVCCPLTAIRRNHILFFSSKPENTGPDPALSCTPSCLPSLQKRVLLLFCCSCRRQTPCCFCLTGITPLTLISHQKCKGTTSICVAWSLPSNTITLENQTKPTVLGKKGSLGLIFFYSLPQQLCLLHTCKV